MGLVPRCQFPHCIIVLESSHENTLTQAIGCIKVYVVFTPLRRVERNQWRFLTSREYICPLLYKYLGKSSVETTGRFCLLSEQVFREMIIAKTGPATTRLAWMPKCLYSTSMLFITKHILDILDTLVFIRENDRAAHVNGQDNPRTETRLHAHRTVLGIGLHKLLEFTYDRQNRK